jgi:hypothetical protein
LRRILESEAIPKVGVGFSIDGRVLYEAVGKGLVIRNFVDIGLMTKYCDPRAYATQDQTPLGLARCVLDVLGKHIEKGGQRSLRWDGALTDDHKLCKLSSEYAQLKLRANFNPDAGLDAQSSLEVYNIVAVKIIAKAAAINKDIPRDWYTFNCREGRPTRLEKSDFGEYLPWAPCFCTWYQNGRFIGCGF